MTGFITTVLSKLRARTDIRPSHLYASSVQPSSHRIHADERLSIPIAARSANDLAGQALLERGRHLARQEMWTELSAEMTRADQARAAAPGGIPVCDLLAYGARSDVVLTVEHALADNMSADANPLIDGIAALEMVLSAHQDDPMIALVVAMAHIDIAWAWRGTGWETTLPQLNRQRCAAHFDRAKSILAPHCTSNMQSPALAAASCALIAGSRAPDVDVSGEYETLIDLDPGNHRTMRALGTHLLPRWFGSYEMLELAALKCAARSRDIWGAGGYTWVYFDAITMDEEACARVDVDYFVEGLWDIAQRRPEQEMINLLTAFCAVAIQNGLGLDEKADLKRTQISEAANWLIRDHLTELHPLIWAHASDGFSNNARINSPSRFAARGRADAMLAISTFFRDELRRGQNVTFTPTGPRYSPHG